jgi:hypothetical protein
VQVAIDGAPPVTWQVGNTLLELPLAGMLTPGTHRLQLTRTGDLVLWEVVLSGACEPQASPGPLRLTTSLDADHIQVGDPMVLSLHVAANGRAIRDPMVAIGLPAGLVLPPKALDDLVARREAHAWELRDGCLVLYLGALDADQEQTIAITGLARWAGIFRAAPASAWDYYAAQRTWVEPLSLTVVSR